jgi:hypothetical protein
MKTVVALVVVCLVAKIAQPVLHLLLEVGTTFGIFSLNTGEIATLTRFLSYTIAAWFFFQLRRQSSAPIMRQLIIPLAVAGLLTIIFDAVPLWVDDYRQFQLEEDAAKRGFFPSHLKNYVMLLATAGHTRRDHIPVKWKVAVLENKEDFAGKPPNAKYSTPPRKFMLDFSYAGIPSNLIASSPTEVKTLVFLDWEDQILSWQNPVDYFLGIQIYAGKEKIACYKTSCTVTVIDLAEEVILSQKTFIGLAPESSETKVPLRAFSGPFPVGALQSYVGDLFKPENLAVQDVTASTSLHEDMDQTLATARTVITDVTASTPVPTITSLRWVTTADGSLYDTKTSLTWVFPVVPLKAMRWEEAKAYCDHLEIGGGGGWRLPSPDELTGIMVTPMFKPPLIGTKGFFWTSKSHQSGATAVLFPTRERMDDIQYAFVACIR